MAERKCRLFFVEPSKVDRYHITLIDGYLVALNSSAAIGRTFDLIVWLNKSTFSNLSLPLRERITYRPIPVINQAKHHVVRKSLVEFWVTARCLISLRKGDVAFVSCIMPTSLLLLELLNSFLCKNGLYVVIHGEIDALVEGRREHWRSIGFWAVRWLKLRPKASRIIILVIDDFIKNALLTCSEGKLTNLRVVHHPITAVPAIVTPAFGMQSVCFVGFRTKSKGFADFEQASKRHPYLTFLAIGQGRAENFATGQTKLVSGSQEFLSMIGACSAAIFPYTDGYSATLSAAALDALSAGVHIIATARPFFLSLAQYFGPEFVTIYHSQAELDELLSDSQWLADRQSDQGRRLAALEGSKYGIDSVRVELETLFLSKG